MSKTRVYMVLFLCFLAETGLVAQFFRPNYFFNSAIIIVGTNYMVARIIILINMLGMLIFEVAVFRGNIKGRLHVSYILMMQYR